jgi:hypothetical protein
MSQQSNNDTSDYDSDYSDDINYEEFTYDFDEISPTKYNLVFCELYNDKIHGNTNKEVCKHYLLINKLKKLDKDYINNITKAYNKGCIERQQQIIPHKFIKNYENIITRPNYIKPEIGETITLQSGHIVCIIKTLWIKLIQRAWKRIFEKRKQIIKMRCQVQSLKYREVTGRWPKNCRYFPSLQGLLLTTR